MLLGRKLGEHRRLDPDDPQARRKAAKVLGRLPGDLRRAAEQEHAVPAPGRLLAESVDRVGAGHAFRQRPAQQTRVPDQRHAVGHQEGRPTVDLRQAALAIGEHGVVEVGRDEVARRGPVNQPVDKLEHLLGGDSGERQSPDSDGLEAGAALRRRSLGAVGFVDQSPGWAHDSTSGSAAPRIGFLDRINRMDKMGVRLKYGTHFGAAGGLVAEFRKNPAKTAAWPSGHCQPPLTRPPGAC